MVAVVPVVKRFFAGAVAGEQQPPLAIIPQRDREHAVQLLKAIHTLFFVEVDNHLAIREGAKTMATLNKPGAQLAEVVNLAVEDKRDVGGLIRKRLVTRLKIDDLETANSECEVGPLDSA